MAGAVKGASQVSEGPNLIPRQSALISRTQHRLHGYEWAGSSLEDTREWLQHGR